MICGNCGICHARDWHACPRCGRWSSPDGPLATGVARQVPLHPVMLSTGVAVLLAGVAVVGPLFASGTNSAPQQSSYTYTSTQSSVDGGAGQSSAGPTYDMPSPVDTRAQAVSQAQRVQQLLISMQSSRRTLAAAMQNVQSCTQVSAAVSDLNQVTQERADQLATANGLVVDQLPGGQGLKDALAAALSASQQADAAYARWAGAAVGQCGARPPANSDKQQGDQYSKQATASKQTVIQAWNQIAGDYDLPSLQEAQI